MSPPLTANERFLVDFHGRRAGATTQAYLPLRARKAGGEAASSCAFLADLVQQAGDAPVVLDMACGDLMLRALRAARQRGAVFSPALGDRRLGHVDRIVPLLSSARFEAVTVEDITLTRPCTPLALWHWFEGMYDMHGMRADDKARLRDDYLQGVLPLCDAQGCIVHTDVLRQVRTTAA